MFGGAYELTNGVSKKYYSFGGQTIMRDANGLQYFITDHLGSTVAITDISGNITSQQRYLPFGQVRTDVPSPNPQFPITDLGYTGQRQLDGGMGGLMDYHARFYDPYLNHFTQPDSVTPSGPQGLNHFSYANNNPVSYTDPNGHWPIPCPSCAWNSFKNWWTGKDVGYTGSGGALGHGPRQLVGTLLGYSKSDEASSFTELVIRGLLQYDHTTITGDLLEQIQSDPDAKHNRQLAVQYAQHDPRYGVEDYSMPPGHNTVHLGEGLGAWDDIGNIPNKFKAYSNLPTLAMRNADFNYTVDVSKDKQIQANITINDTLDLTDENPRRWWGYRMAVNGFGFLYHTVLGGNKKMKTSASWTWSE